MDKQYYITLFDDKRLDLLSKMCRSVKMQGQHTTVLYNNITSKLELDIVKEYGFEELKNLGDTCLKHSQKVLYALNNADNGLVYFSDADDISFITRTAIQEKEILKFESVLSTASSVIFTNDIYTTMETPRVTPDGIICSYPSTWCFNKKLLPHIDKIDILDSENNEWDNIFIMQVLKIGNIISTYDPLSIHNFYDQSTTAKITDQNNRDIVKKYYQDNKHLFKVFRIILSRLGLVISSPYV